MHSEADYRLALALISGVGVSSFQKAIQHFGNAEQVFLSGSAARKNSGCFRGKALEGFNEKLWEILEAHQAWQQQQSNRQIILCGDRDYPAHLGEIDTPPLLLLAKGKVEILRDPQVAIVGARSCSRQGKDFTFKIAGDLATMGLTITSGMASGIDSAAHWGTLAKEGDTIAVMGCDIEHIYPAANRQLYDKIVAQGLVISEFPLGTKPMARHFPRRNRIVTGLSEGILIVEAKIASGSMTSAQHALQQGKEVFAVPGSVHNPLSKGCHFLIKDGAKLVENASDIVMGLSSNLQSQLDASPEIDGIDTSGAPSITPVQSEAAKPTGSRLKSKSKLAKPMLTASRSPPPEPPLSTDLLDLLESIGFDPTPIDVMMEKTGMSIGECQSKLLLLELDGFIVAGSAGQYLRKK